MNTDKKADKSVTAHELFDALHQLEIATKNLTVLADAMEKSELKKQIGMLISLIVAEIDFKVVPLLRQQWTDVAYSPVE